MFDRTKGKKKKKKTSPLCTLDGALKGEPNFPINAPFPFTIVRTVRGRGVVELFAIRCPTLEFGERYAQKENTGLIGICRNVCHKGEKGWVPTRAREIDSYLLRTSTGRAR